MASTAVLPSPARSRGPGALGGAAFAAAVCLLAFAPAAANAQAAPAAAAPTLQSVEVTGRLGAGIGGFDTPLARTPQAAEVVSAATLADLGATSLADLTRLDASLSDAYNAEGYWTFFTVRGFVIDNRANFRRDGLPINAETALPLANKVAVEVLKGLGGTQAGTSAPGGLVNLVVKRPDIDLRSASLAAVQGGGVRAGVDLSQRWGEQRAFGLRVNLDAERLAPQTRDADGRRHLLALAADWRPDAGHHLEIEFEHSLQRQPSVPGFSLLGDTLPSPKAIDPRINLNDQAWSQPVVLQGNVATVRWTQQLDANWRLQLHAGRQALVSNDRIAFPYGFAGCDPCDRYASDGSFSLWDFRSDNERRRTDALDASLHGELEIAGQHHALSFGALHWNYRARFNDEAYNLVGVGTIDGLTQLPGDPSLTSPNTNRDEHDTELSLHDRIDLAADWTAWAGVRHTQLHRRSVLTALAAADPQATDYRQGFTTPWLALSHQVSADDMAWLSWGEGTQSDVTPNVPAAYRSPGAALPTAISRQWEAGYKHADTAGRSWGLTLFDIRQPQSTDVADDGGLLVRRPDGRLHARGLEAEAQLRQGPLTLRASAMWERMRREGQADPVATGPRPTNVPAQAIKGLATWRFASVPGLAALVAISHEGNREVLPDDTVTIPAWTRIDLGASYTAAPTAGGATVTWRAALANATGHRAWRESPYQYGHAYLFPLSPRSLTLSVEAAL